MRKAEKLAAVTQILANCTGFEDSDQVASAIETALNYYYMRARGDEQAGRSAVISGDLSAMTEAVLSQMMGAYTTARTVEFEPEGGEDKDGPEIETALCVSAVKKNRGYIKFQQSIKDALMHRLGVMKVWPKDAREVRQRDYRQVTPEAFAELTREKPGIRLERIDYKRRRLTYSEVRERKMVKIDPVDVGNFVCTKNWHTYELDAIPCVGERHVTTRSEMISEYGFDRKKVERLSPYLETRGVETARNPKGQVRQGQSADPATDFVEWFELYVMLDADGDGIAERRKICVVPNKEIFSDEITPFPPYAVGSVLLAAHRMWGVSLFDKLKQTQDERTGLKRQRMDNGNAVNKNRVVYLEGKVDRVSLEDGRINSNVAVTGAVQDVRQAAAALVVPDMSGSIAASMDQTARERAELGGAALELASGNAQLTDKVGSQGLDRAYSVMEQLAELMMHNTAQTLIADTYLLVHRTYREYFDGALTVNRRGQPAVTRPSEWPIREEVTVILGMSPGERRRRLEGLDWLLQFQLVLLKEGQHKIMVDKRTLYDAAIARSRTADVPNPELYLLDPLSDESRQAEADRDAALKADREAQQRLMQTAMGLEQLRIALEKRAADADRVLEYFKTIMDAEKAEAGVVGKATADFELAHMQAAQIAQQAREDKETLNGVGRALEEIKKLKGDGEPMPHNAGAVN